MNVIQYRICSSYTASWLQSAFKNDIQVYNRSKSKLIGEIWRIVPSLTDGNQNHFYRMLVCLVKRQAVIFSPSSGPLPLTFTCAGGRAGESPGSGATHPWGLVPADSQRERIYREYSQSATTMLNSIVSLKVVQLNRFRHEMTIFKSMTMLLPLCTLYGIVSYAMIYVLHKTYTRLNAITHLTNRV